MACCTGRGWAVMRKLAKCAVSRSRGNLIGGHLQAAVDHAQALGGAAGQGDLPRAHLQVARGPVADLAFALPFVLAFPVHQGRRVAVDFLAVIVDGLLYRARVGGDEEVGEVRGVAVEGEQLAQLAPFVGALEQWRGGRRLGGVGQRAGQGQAGTEDGGLLEEGTAVGHGGCGPVQGVRAATGRALFCTCSQTRRKLPPHSLAISASL